MKVVKKNFRHIEGKKRKIGKQKKITTLMERKGKTKKMKRENKYL